jgi:hypothetical protein
VWNCQCNMPRMDGSTCTVCMQDIHIFYFSFKCLHHQFMSAKYTTILYQLNLTSRLFDQLNLTYSYRKFHVSCVLYIFLYTIFSYKIPHDLSVYWGCMSPLELQYEYWWSYISPKFDILEANLRLFSNSKITAAHFSCPDWFSPGAKSLIQRILDPNPNTVSTCVSIFDCII